MAQKGKQISRIPFPRMARLIALDYRLQEMSMLFRQELETIHAGLSRYLKLFASAVRRSINSETRQLRKLERSLRRQAELKEIGRRLQRTI